tara:strand:- start:441 stop:950 length:510 start_codon:yes stop_codon:yes gene_type:complete
MSLWGTKDTVYSTGKVNCTTAGVLTKQSGSINFNTSCKVGMVVTLATDGAGVGEGVIKSIDSNTQMTLSNLNLPGAFTNVNYEVREKPVTTIGDSNWDPSDIYGVDTTEQSVANAASGEARKYAPPHAGWVGITTYTDQHGTLRVKHEVLVAGSSITGDSGDDTLLPDS